MIVVLLHCIAFHFCYC